jgi:hypothetical protein
MSKTQKSILSLRKESLKVMNDDALARVGGGGGSICVQSVDRQSVDRQSIDRQSVDRQSIDRQSIDRQSIDR